MTKVSYPNEKLGCHVVIGGKELDRDASKVVLLSATKVSLSSSKRLLPRGEVSRLARTIFGCGAHTLFGGGVGSSPAISIIYKAL